jgi:hypothetical protein
LKIISWYNNARRLEESPKESVSAVFIEGATVKHNWQKFLASCIFLTGCAGANHSAPNTGQIRCEQEGLCLTEETQESLQGAYRRGEREVQFDVISRPHFLGVLNRGNKFCSRIIWDGNHPFFMRDNGNCPQSWLKMPAVIFSPDDNAAYHAMMHDLLLEAQSRQFSAKNPQVWQEIVRDLREIQSDRKIKPVPKNVVIENGGAESDKINRMVLSPAHGDISYPPKLQKDKRSPGTASQALSSGGKTPALRSARFAHSGLEFTQVIELHSQPTKSFLFFGWHTDSDHSATRTHVYYRGLDSNAQWVLLQTYSSGNHGAGPFEDDMRLYEICDNLPVTKEYFSVGGECEGGWAVEHLCNDDTAYQVWHAYGAWNGGNHCLRKRRLHRPGCNKPW